MKYGDTVKQEKRMKARAKVRGGAQTTPARRGAAVAVGLMIGGLLFAPAAPAFAETTPQAGAECTVTAADLGWGVKQSFRNYISGSIANGEWTTENGASYETPNFMWSGGTGTFAADLESGAVAFTGDVNFTGHGGAMKLDISNPEIEFTGGGDAQLVLAVGSTDVEGAEPTFERVSVAKVTLAGHSTAEGDKLIVAEAPVRLTSEGAAAMNGEYGSYVSGEEMDPISLSVTATGCDLTAAAVPTEAPAEESPSAEAETPAPAPVEDAPSVPWLPIGIGAVALIAIGVTVGMLVAGSRKGTGAGVQNSQDSQGSQGSQETEKSVGSQDS